MIDFTHLFEFAARTLGAALCGFSLTLFAIPLAKSAALHFGIVTAPDQESARKSAIPLIGGVSIVSSALISAALFTKLPLWMLLGASGLTLVGLIDDAIALQPSSKLLFEALVIAVLMLFFPPLALAPWPLVSIAIVIFFFLSTVNAYNLIDGLDGLAAGIGICSALSIAAIGAGCGDLSLACQSLGIAGALTGFLLFNNYPATIFMGDCGALPLGFLLGAMALQASSDAVSSWLPLHTIPLLIMLVPLLDMTTVTLSRVSRDAPVTRRGLDHSHHKLLALGLSERLTVRICWSVAALAGGSAVLVARIDTAIVTLLLPSVAAILTMLALYVVDLKFDAPPFPVSAFPDLPIDAHQQTGSRSASRQLASVCFDALLVTAAYCDAFLIRLGPAIGNARMIAIATNIPPVLLASYISFLSFGIYRRAAPRLDLMRFAGAAAGAGILILLASYLLPMMASGAITLIFVLVLFSFLAASRLSFEVLPGIIIRLARVPQWTVAHLSTSYTRTVMVAPSEGGNVTPNETEIAKKVMAR